MTSVLFNDHGINIFVADIIDQLSKMENHPPDSTKGKWLELLSAATLVSYKDRTLYQIELFKKAIDSIYAPNWLKNLKDNRFKFTKFRYANSSTTIISLLNHSKDEEIILPPKEARPDIFCIIGNTVLLGGMKFYTSDVPKDQLLANKDITNIDKVYQSKKKGKKMTSYRLQFESAIDNFKDESIGTFRLLVTLPNAYNPSPVRFKNYHDNDRFYRTDVILNVSLDNLQDFFDEKTANFLTDWYNRK